MIFQVQDVIKILVAILLGGLIGAEREARDKSAGFRTIILICLGATLFTILSYYLTGGTDTARVAANIVTGIGFLGAGAILREGNQVRGLTTAASIWLAASVGMAVGIGEYLLSAIVTLAALAVLWLFPAIEAWMGQRHQTCSYQVVYSPEVLPHQQLESIFTQNGLKVVGKKHSKLDHKVITEWKAAGTSRAHEGLVEALVNNSEVHELTY